MEGQVNPGLFIFWVISSGFASMILFLVVVFIVESLKPKPPVFLGPRQNLELQQRIDDKKFIKNAIRTGIIHKDFEKWLRD